MGACSDFEFRVCDPFCSPPQIELPVGVLPVHRKFIPNFADCLSCLIFTSSYFGADAYHSIRHRGFHVTLTICQWQRTNFQLLHSPLLESDRAARGRSLFEKKSYRLEEQSIGFSERDWR